MKLWIVAIVSSLTTAVIILAIIFVPAYLRHNYISPLGNLESPSEYPLDKYSFERLSQYTAEPSDIELEGVISQEDEFTAYLFNYTSQGKKVTGQLNKPKKAGRLPVVIMLRGFVEPSIYETGLGTRNAAAVFANSGYVTVAPDFLGYGGSDDPDNDSFGARVQRPVTVLDLIASVKQLEYVNPDKIFVWGHSNGGQIAISLLEITRQNYPTTLWAPVTKPFPYSVLFYTDEYSDFGKSLRKALSVFETVYDTDNYSIISYLDQISAPIQLHQGGADDAVPLEWSDDFVQALEESNPDAEINYYTYPNADHNLRPDWNTVISRDLTFFNSFLDTE